MEDENRKHVLIDGLMLHQKALNLCDFSKGSPEMSDTEPFTASKGWLHRFRNKVKLKNTEITRVAASAKEEASAIFPTELKKPIKHQSKRTYAPQCS